MPGTPLPTPPVRLAVSIPELVRNTALQADLRSCAVDCQERDAAIWVLSLTQVLDKHGYRLEIFRD